MSRITVHTGQMIKVLAMLYAKAQKTVRDIDHFASALSQFISKPEAEDSPLSTYIETVLKQVKAVTEDYSAEPANLSREAAELAVTAIGSQELKSRLEVAHVSDKNSLIELNKQIGLICNGCATGHAAYS